MTTGKYSPPTPCLADSSGSAIIQNLVIGLTVSFVALSLGAALGILSGRGAFAGMISAGIIALVTSAFGGTRIQCSGPTAPMSAVSAVTVAFAHEQLIVKGLTVAPEHFINIVFFLCALLLLAMGVLRLGRFICYVPNVVISGFMSGIALLIWQDQIKALFGFGGKSALTGPQTENLAVALGTVALIFLVSPLMRRIVGSWARFLPSTLIAIVVMTVVALVLHLPIEHIQLGAGVTSFADFTNLLRQQFPTNWSLAVLLAALPFAVQLSLLGYLDTLLTSLVIDKLSGEQTRQDRELCAQGLANGSAALFGGIPGAQATIRSVLMLKEQATLRLAGIMVGVFVLIEMLLFQELLTLIPKAVFVGVLLKVGYDVFDWLPLKIWCSQVRILRAEMFRHFFSRHDDNPIFVTNRELLMITGTAAVTVVVDLNIAVIGFTVLFYLHNKILNRQNPMRDLVPEAETKAFLSQN